MFRERTMKAAWRWLLATVVCLTVGQGLAPAKSAKPPAATALVGWMAGGADDADIGVVGGPVAGRGWVGGEQAKGLMHHGDRLALYGMESGPIGSATLTNDGILWSQNPDNARARGLEYQATWRVAPGKDKLADREPLLAVWHAPGSPEPRWVRAKVLSPKSRAYREIASRWLRGQGATKEAIEGFRIEQLVQADVNQDGREEVFLSLHWFDQYAVFSSGDIHYEVASPHATKGFSYLLMRYLPRGSRRPRTVVVEGETCDVHRITGLCDLDCDGWAEVVTEQTAYEDFGKRLYHWTGRGFRAIQGEKAWA
jgi:hypothetical protein